MNASWQGPSSRALRFGEWSLTLRGDELADIRYQQSPVVRSVRAVARDHDWNTAAWVIEREDIREDGLTLLMRSNGHGLGLRATLRIFAGDDGVAISLECVPTAEAWTNRTGLVLLQSPTLAGSPLGVVHADGTEERGTFPLAISPHQPVRDIAALRWADDGLDIVADFRGDVFEMEDQRNWSDASYKTYSRPLDLPFPYLLSPGTPVRQQIQLSAHRTAPRATPPAHPAIELKRAGSFPVTQVAASNAPDPRPARTRRVGEVRLVELDLGSSNWEAAWARAAGDGMPLDVRYILPRTDRRGALKRAVELLADAPVRRVAAFDAERHISTIDATGVLREMLHEYGVTLDVVGGARSHFTELNREKGSLPEDLDGVVFAVTPLFHSLDTEQLVDSVAIQRRLAVQAVQIAGGAPVHIGPVTLRPRFNNVATAPAPAPSSDDLREGYGAEFTGEVDERQGADELAAWTVAAAAALAVSGVASITWFEEWGDRGVFDRAGERRPVVGALDALARLGGCELLSGNSPDGLVWAVGARTASHAHVLVANLDSRARTVGIAWGDHQVSVPVGSFQWTSVARGETSP